MSQGVPRVQVLKISKEEPWDTPIPKILLGPHESMATQINNFEPIELLVATFFVYVFNISFVFVSFLLKIRFHSGR